MKLCSIPDCGKPAHSGKFCSGHGHRLRRYGDPLGRPPRRLRNLTNQRLGQLHVLGIAVFPTATTNTQWLCRCDCGKIFTVDLANLGTGKTRSCGHTRYYARFQHGHSRSSKKRVYRIWIGMLKRCADPNEQNYGGRGITVCDRWRTGSNGRHPFLCFLDDMGYPPSSKHSIDRWPDNDGNYGPDNCRWGTPIDQGNNKRTNRIYVYKDRSYTVSELSRFFAPDINKEALNRRLTYLHWDIERALTQPLEYRRPRRGK